MTDKVSYSMTTLAKEHEGGLTYNCSAAGIGIVIMSDLFLANQDSGTVMFRYDEGKPDERQALLKGHGALLPLAHRPHDPKEFDVDRALFELSAGIALADALKPAKRMRVRLTSLAGDTRDLDFDVTGLSEKLPKMQKRCGFVGKRVAADSYWADRKPG